MMNNYMKYLIKYFRNTKVKFKMILKVCINLGRKIRILVLISSIIVGLMIVQI